MKRREFRVFESAADVALAVAEDLENAIRVDVSTRDECHVVLTGGTLGIALLHHVGAKSDVDWSRVHFWWGDERFVNPESPDRNEGQAWEALLNRIDVPAENIHRMGSTAGYASADDATSSYANSLEEFFGVDFPHFDVVLLGVGPDSHVASLFPRLPGVLESGKTVIAVRNSPKPPPERVSLTLPSINASRRVWVVAAGNDKAEAIRSSESANDPSVSPVSAVHGIEETVFFVDNAAFHAEHLSRSAGEA